MVEIKSGALLGAHGRYQGMVIFQKGKKTYGRALPSYDGNADSPSRKVQNARLAAAVTHYQTIKETFLYHAWRMEATRREVISGYNLFLKQSVQHGLHRGRFQTADAGTGSPSGSFPDAATGSPGRRAFHHVGSLPVGQPPEKQGHVHARRDL